jgi:hypothetical protein
MRPHVDLLSAGRYLQYSTEHQQAVSIIAFTRSNCDRFESTLYPFPKSQFTMLFSLIMALSPFAAESSLEASEVFPLTRPKNTNNAKAKFMNRVMSKARRLEDNDNEDEDEDEYMPDLTQYNLVFEKCQFMRYYDECDDDGSCLSTGSYAIFRLCPSCSSCNYNYGEYMMGLDDYLTYTTEYYQEKQEDECEWCAETCYYDYNNGEENADEAEEEDGDQEEDGEEDGDEEDGGEDEEGEDRRLADSSYDCSTCQSNCDKWNNMEANGYVQATEYLGCVELYQDYYGQQYYAGAMCGNSDGNKIKIGVFMDANCASPTGLDIETYVNMAANQRRERELENNNNNAIKVSHSILKHVYNSGNCVSCGVEAEQEDENGYYDGDENNNEVLDICENIYNSAAKCETSHGFDENQYLSSNQASQEKTVCNLINQLKSGTYDSISGEIDLQGKSKSFSSVKATGGQKFALTSFVLATCGLAVYSAMLHQKLVKGSGGRLSQAGGAMA